jgi:hypothetical protein
MRFGYCFLSYVAHKKIIDVLFCSFLFLFVPFCSFLFLFVPFVSGANAECGLAEAEGKGVGHGNHGTDGKYQTKLRYNTRQDERNPGQAEA